MAESWGRRWTLVFFLAGSILITPVVFLLIKGAPLLSCCRSRTVFSPAAFTDGTLFIRPELFPTRIRSSAISIIFNSARFLAMLGPILSSSLIAFFGGYGIAATIASGIFLIGIVAIFFLPETKGRPLPA